jgi:TP901 family phage tail tape measure protein
MLFFDFLTSFMPIILGLMGVLMVVLRAGASRVFFDVVGTFQAEKLISDTSAHMTTMQALVVDGLAGIEDAGSMLAEQMNQVVEATVPLAEELEKATIQFEKFISTGARLEGTLTRDIKEVGMQFGFTANQSLEAGARMAQLSSILGEDVIPQATEAALAFGLMGDMTPETAMIKLINLQQQTGFAFNNTTQASYNQMTAEQKRLQVTKEMARTLNQLNSVEDHSAATLSKITGVMNEFASQAHLAGESISMMAAQSAALIEAGEEQGKAGRALRMTYARLGADTSGAATALNELGVETQNANGSLKPMSEIMKNLNPQWQTFNSGQKQAIAQQVAGNRHYVRFIKLMEAYDRVMSLNNEATEMTAAVMDDAGNATGFLADMMDSNAVAMDKARAEMELVNAQLGDVLLPGQIRALQAQVAWNQSIVNTITAMGALGGVIGGVVGFSSMIQKTFAPFFSAFINIKSANVALMTQMQIIRALSGVELARSSSYRQNLQMQIKMEKNRIISEKLLQQTKKVTEQIENRILISQIKLRKVYRNNHLQTKAINQELRTKTIPLKAELNALEFRHQMLLHGTKTANDALNASMMKTSMMFMKIGGALMIMEMLFVGVAKHFKVFGNEQEVMRTAMILTTATMALMMLETIISTGAILKQAVAHGANSRAKFVQVKATGSLIAAETTYTAVTAKATLATMSFWRALGIAGVAVFGIGLLLNAVLPKIDNTTDSVKDLALEAEDLASMFGDVESQMSLSFGSDVDMSGLDAMQDATAKFSSGREEMFMGFKAGNVTGDLIKQVQQGGVENFVANTEIIMNNNFTGLTSDQIAQEVISQIQRTATGNGIIVS